MDDQLYNYFEKNKIWDQLTDEEWNSYHWTVSKDLYPNDSYKALQHYLTLRDQWGESYDYGLDDGWTRVPPYRKQDEPTGAMADVIPVPGEPYTGRADDLYKGYQSEGRRGDIAQPNDDMYTIPKNPKGPRSHYFQEGGQALFPLNDETVFDFTAPDPLAPVAVPPLERFQGTPHQTDPAGRVWENTPYPEAISPGSGSYNSGMESPVDMLGMALGPGPRARLFGHLNSLKRYTQEDLSIPRNVQRRMLADGTTTKIGMGRFDTNTTRLLKELNKQHKVYSDKGVDNEVAKHINGTIKLVEILKKEPKRYEELLPRIEARLTVLSEMD